MTDNKNFLLAIVLSVVILIGFQMIWGVFFPEPPPQQPVAVETPGSASSPTAAPSVMTPAPATPAQPAVPGVSLPSAAPGQPAGQAAAPGGLQARSAVLARSPRVRINTPAVHGSIALTGGRLDDLTLARYRETLDPHSPEIVLFSPLGAKDAYFAEVGWVASGGSVAVPGPDTQWTADRSELTPGQPVTLSWNNGAGLIFKRTFAVDENYMFTITQTVENRSEAAVSLAPYALVSRFGLPHTSGFFILFEGPLGVFDGTLSQFSYEEVSDKGLIPKRSTGGWIGITDKYWLAALIPPQSAAVDARFVHQRPGGSDQFQVDFVGHAETAAPGGMLSASSQVFAGAKVVRLIDNYERTYGIDRFDLAIDWGWFYFLTRPVFYALEFIHRYVGNFGVAILILTVLIKIAFFPLANKSYKAMSLMRKLQPEMLRLRERFGDDKMRLNQEMMALYKREKVNPASGCLPILIQIPVFFALYKVLFVTIEMRHAPFFGWIRDLSAPDPTSVFNLFGAIPWAPPQFLMIGAWPLLMGVTMYLQQKLNPQPPDPIQQKLFLALPFVFTFMLAQFPAGLVIYWTWNNILSIIQQWVIMRRAGVNI